MHSARGEQMRIRMAWRLARLAGLLYRCLDSIQELQALSHKVPTNANACGRYRERLGFS
jgi:hypothetical protein